MVDDVGDDVFVFRREHLAALPDDGNKYEILDGKLLVSPSPTRMHQYVVARLTYLLTQHLHDTDGQVFGNDIDLVFAETTVLIPDISVFAPGGANPVIEDPDRLGDLVVEVSSPSTRRRDMTLKRDAYARDGVPEYWFVDLHTSRIHVHVHDGATYDVTLHEAEDLASSTLLPGFTTRLADLLP